MVNKTLVEYPRVEVCCFLYSLCSTVLFDSLAHQTRICIPCGSLEFEWCHSPLANDWVCYSKLYCRKNLQNAAYPEIVFCYITRKFAYFILPHIVLYFIFRHSFFCRNCVAACSQRCPSFLPLFFFLSRTLSPILF